jgi:GDPmannose 4,6-dehydratase
MKSIIFGANGQDGYYLAELLRSINCTVIGISRNGNFLRTDITNYREVEDLIQKQQPEFVFHLAANSTTSHHALFENHATIATGTINILEAIKNVSPHTKAFISGSGLQFVNKGLPIKETDEFEARDAYSVSRIQSVFASRYYRLLGVKVYVGYLFNHDSPLRTNRHIAKKISDGAKKIAAGNEEMLEIGDIKVIKEWTFAGDVVKGIWVLVSQDEVFEANIGSGIGFSIEDWIKLCFGLIKKDWQKYIVHKNEFKAEYRSLVSDSSLLNSLGWSPEISFEQLGRIMMQ